MGLRERLSALDVRAGVTPLAGPQGRRDFLDRIARSRWRSGYVHRQVFEELVELHDRVAVLEARLAALEAGRST